MNYPLNCEKGFTGLEAALILIAFIVVAAVFAYVILGAGFFTTQKAQETIYTGIKQVGSTLQIAGHIYGKGTAGDSITWIGFDVGLAAGGTSVDLDKTVLTYSIGSYMETLTPRGKSVTLSDPLLAGQWGFSCTNEVTADDTLQKGEICTISLMPTTPLQESQRFTLEVKPSGGEPISISRTAPGSIESVNVLD